MKSDSLEDNLPFVVENDEEEEFHVEPHAETEDTSVPHPPSPKTIKLVELLVKSMTAELSKLLTVHAFSSLIRTELKELLSKINDINEAMRGLNKYVEGLEIKIPGDLK
nr:hypothetical protein [Tanacetum cinerariifolium]